MSAKVVYAAERAIPPWDCDADPANLTLTAATLLIVMAREPDVPRYAYELSRLTGYNTVFIKYVLERYAERGWLAEVDQLPTSPPWSGSGRPRRYFILTSRGRAEVTALRSYLRALVAGSPTLTSRSSDD